MFIKKIEVAGSGKSAATLEFNKGLNVVAGASNTGKSYVVQCIQFALGSSTVPTPLKESDGYEFVELTLVEDDEVLVLRRPLKKNANISVIRDGNKPLLSLKPKHLKGDKTFSNWFLAKIHLNDKVLLKSKKNLTTQALTLRTLENIFIVDETRIVAKHSPLGKGQRTDISVEQSLLRALLTGQDESDVKKLKVDSESQGAINRKIDNLKEFLDKFHKSSHSTGLSSEQIENSLVSVNVALAKADQELGNLISENHSLLERRRVLRLNIQALSGQHSDQLALTTRFKLLHEKYESDKSRLNAIAESALLFDHFESAICPTCGQDFDEVHNHEGIENIALSAEGELGKIAAQLSDLDQAIEELELDTNRCADDLAHHQVELELIDAEIRNSIQAKFLAITSKKRELSERKDNLQRSKVETELRERVVFDLRALEAQATAKQPVYEMMNFSTELSSLTTEIEEILARWGYPNCRPASYSTQSRDLIIGDIPRANYGKGYRAIAFSAFIIGLMTATLKSGRHPGFVILDSPLTTYKKADIDRGESDESVDADMIYAVYRDLCDSYNEQQIIIFDNQEPDDDLKPSMRYEHFSKNKNIGRYGFFPV